MINGMIGLEIHCYLVTREKLFCRCKATRERGTKPNTLICPVCCGIPGAKPMLPNKAAVEKAVQIGLLLGCEIQTLLPWRRKHYDWPDLPKGYQQTLSGPHAFPVGIQGKFLGITISSMHLEEDPASWTPDTGAIDYNRSGLPLVEIITAPEFSTAEEVRDWLKKLLHALAYLHIVDTNAGIKVDVNVNIPGKTARVEVKNLNSLESIGQSIDYELDRQQREGGKQQETRRYDESSGKTMKMRSKEDQEDYRFMQEPDLPPIVLDNPFIIRLKKQMPETPEQKLKKLVSHYNIDARNAALLAKHLDVVEFFERVAQHIKPEFALSWVTVELLRLLNEHKKRLDELDIQVDHFVALLKLVQEGTITPLQAKQLLKEFYPRSFIPKLSEKINDPVLLKKIILNILEKHSKAVEDYKSGEKKSFDFLLGEIMKKTEKRADYKVARKLLMDMLK